MKKQEKAKELLFTSYCMSAKRINSALRLIGKSNSHLPHPNNEIIGLCGQGGRHHYFHISKQDLELAVTKILELKREILFGRKSSEHMLDEVAVICQSLRRKTHFDSGTGCINDDVPAIVPILPPEAIMLNGQELPLDVWRLISFEFDLGSPALSSYISDVSHGSFTLAALSFSTLMNSIGKQEIEFTLFEKKMPKDLKKQLNCPTSVKTSLARLFFEAGCLLTPLADQAFSQWYLAIRYFHWLSKKSTKLCVEDKFNTDPIDSRYKGIFSEEMAIGLMAIVLSDKLGVFRINNTVEIIPKSSYPTGKPIADFVALGQNLKGTGTQLIVAESKGSLGSKVSKKRRKRAKEQVMQTSLVVPGTTDTLALTFCSSLYYTSQKIETNCLIEDPPPEQHSEPIRIDSVHAWRVAYSKALRFVGLEVASRQVLRGEPATFLRDSRRENADQRDQRRNLRDRWTRNRFNSELISDVGSWGVMLDRDVLEILRKGISPEENLELQGILNRRQQIDFSESTERISFQNSLGIGCVNYSEIG